MTTVAVLAEAIALIGEVVARVKEKRQTSGIGAAADALTIIGAIVESVDDGRVDRVTPEIAMEELGRLRQALSDNDTAAMKALEDKFDTTEG